MLEARIIRELQVADPVAGAGPAHLSAASGLVKLGDRLFVVADDDHHLAVFEGSSSRQAGRLVRLFDGELPLRHAARKAAKPDCEALLLLPAFGLYPQGALLAMGSGSRPSRQRGALLALDAAGDVHGPARSIDLTPLLAPLHDHFPDLNIEGAWVQGDTLSLLQRGNGASAINARIELGWPEVRQWLTAGGPAPQAAAITRFDLGAIDGIPLSFTDGAALPEGGWLFSACAEDTADTYSDGRCAGSVIGLIDAAGTLRTLERLALPVKVEGIAVAAVSGDTVELLMVTDADDRRQPALLLSAALRR